MTEAADFNPYIEGANHDLNRLEVDDHVQKLSIVYYGEMPAGLETVARENHPAIEVVDNSGESKFSVLISGDLSKAKIILVKTMSWSDHPGRGFEALREALIADNEAALAVVGVSFPGTFLASQPMTPRQRESLKSNDFSYIGAQQWQAIYKAMRTELSKGKSSPSANKAIQSYDWVLSGSSQGSPNAVGLFQAAPDWMKIISLGLAQEVSLDETGALAFRRNFIIHGGKFHSNYTAVNPYNQYPTLGPDFGRLTVPERVLFRPASHIGSVLKGMRMGGDAQKIIESVRERDIKELYVTFATGSEDAVAPPEASVRAAKLMNMSARIVARTVIWDGHYHALIDNLANSQHAFRSFAR
jgi:hypothetical protein